jgi:hypothetical protein
MIGVKSVAAVGLTALLITLGAFRHALDPSYLRHLGPGACFLIGLVASLAVALLGVGWRFGVRSRSALALVRGRPAIVIAIQPVPQAARGAQRASGRAAGSEPTAIAGDRSGPELGDGDDGADDENARAERNTSAERSAEINASAAGASKPPRARARAATPARELPGMVQRLLLMTGFAAVVLGALGNHAAARIAQLPDELAAPAPSEYCLPPPEAPAAAAPIAAPPPAEPQGCALVKRAFQLGYARTLGACAPRQAAPIVISPVTRREVCTRRQLDEPFLHYGFRRVAGAFGAATSVDPATAAERRVTDVQTHLTYLDGLLADIRHAITGSPHAAHHVWINLPDPHPGALRDRFLGAPRCSQRFADLPLWPAWHTGDEARLVEHVLGQLLFATRFGTTASCSDYVLHWDAAPDTCRRLAADPIAVLDRDGALAGVRAVLDRRTRQRELGALAAALGRQPPAPPPAAAMIVSLSCLIVDPGVDPGVDPAGRGGTAITAVGDPAGHRGATGTTVAIDGDPVGLRELHVPRLRLAGDGPIEVYAALAELLGGTDSAALAVATASGRAPEPIEAIAPSGEFLLAHLDPLIDSDPFRGARAPLARAELVEVYPFEHHLHGFIDGFRRRYLAQRGRL